MTVWLGAPDPSWIQYADRPLFVSHSRLRRYTTWGLPVAPKDGPGWALDSGAFSFVTKYGHHLDTAEEYTASVARYDARIGGLAWASIQDWMCEDKAFAATGLTLEEHQLRTVRSYVELTALWNERWRLRSSPFRPALQGTTPESYVRCCQLYAEHGVDLAAAEIVGLGSVCRRSRSRDIADVVAAVRDAVSDIQMHGCGVKSAGLKLYGAELATIDSQAWSKAARARKLKSPRCTATHRVCSSCLIFAEDWHDKVTAEHEAARAARLVWPVSNAPKGRPSAGRRRLARRQLTLFAAEDATA